MALPEVLDEISGLVYYPKDSSVFAINDEDGKLFKIRLRTPIEIEQWNFSKTGDFEDLVLVDSSFFILKSKGVLERVRFITRDSVSIDQFKLPAQGVKNEFEALYFDSAAGRIILICKDCESDPADVISTWGFDPRTDSFFSSSPFNNARVKEMLDLDSRFKPSAAAIHPVTKELYVIASVNKALIIFDKNNNIHQAYPLSPAQFKQPEGIAFTPTGDMIISNEFAESGSANIKFFKYRKPNNQ